METEFLERKKKKERKSSLDKWDDSEAGEENIWDEPGTSCEAQKEVLNEGTCQKGTEVNLMDSQWPNLGQQSIKMMIAKDYNP